MSEQKKERNPDVYIGVDLDGTTATYDTWKGWQHIGEPIKTTIDRIKLWLSLGIGVRIVTARVSKASADLNNVTPDDIKKVIQDWCEKHIGVRLEVQCEKDCNMLFLLDDSCVQVVTNTGIPIGGDEAFKVFEDRIKENVTDTKKEEPSIEVCKFKVGDRIKVPETVRSWDRGKCGVIIKIERVHETEDPNVDSSAPSDYWLCWYKIDGSDKVTGVRDYCLLPEPK